MAFLQGWRYYVDIAIDKTNIDSGVTWFPAPLILSTSAGQGSDDVSFIFDELIDNSLKIAVTKPDGITQLYVEVEEWDHVTETAVLWVSRDGWTIDSSASESIRLYFDSNHADNTDYVGTVGNRTEVWDSNYVGVWHLHDNLTNSITNVDATDSGTAGYTSGEIANGREGDGGANDKITTDITPQEGAWTLSCWAYFDDTSSNDSPIGCHDGNNHRCYISLYNNHWQYGAGTNAVSVPDEPSNATWYMATVVADGSDCSLYVDTGKIGGPESYTFSGNSSLPIYILNGTLSAADRPMDGVVDEARFSSVERLPAWIKANYYAQTDDLLAFGGMRKAFVPQITVL